MEIRASSDSDAHGPQEIGGSRMKQTILFLFILLVLVIVSIQCKKSSEPIVGPQPALNLITNSSFESDTNHPTLQGWDYNANNTVCFRDTPPCGGAWSVGLFPLGMPPPAWIIEGVAAPAGTHTCRFSIWAKSRNVNAPWKAMAVLYVKSSDTSRVVSVMDVKDATWAFYGVLDTLITLSGDGYLSA